MTVAADNKKRVVLPGARPGDGFRIDQAGEEIGHLRISTQPVFGMSVAEARRTLKAWLEDRHPPFGPCDVPALETDASPAGSQTTDYYLAALAAKHGMELATLDENITHAAAFLIPA